MNGPPQFDQLGDAVLLEIAGRLGRLDKSLTPARAAARAETIAASLVSGEPPVDLFYLLAAIGVAGAAACVARDHARAARATAARIGLTCPPASTNSAS